MEPGLGIVERGSASYVKDNQGAMCVPEVARDQGLKPLLPCCIPKLQAIAFALILYIFCKEIDADGRLDSSRCTWELSSNLSLTYLSMMLDLPTDWFPKNTILILILPEAVLIDEFMPCFYKLLYNQVGIQNVSYN
jgi:hypothetical protein